MTPSLLTYGRTGHDGTWDVPDRGQHCHVSLNVLLTAAMARFHLAPQASAPDHDRAHCVVGLPAPHLHTLFGNPTSACSRSWALPPTHCWSRPWPEGFLHDAVRGVALRWLTKRWWFLGLGRAVTLAGLTERSVPDLFAVGSGLRPGRRSPSLIRSRCCPGPHSWVASVPCPGHLIIKTDSAPGEREGSSTDC